jgi:hypothetical protein
MSKCTAITKKGEQCQAIAGAGQQYCYMHSPQFEQARHRNAAKGGRIAGRGRPMNELTELKEILRDLARRIESGLIDRADAIAMNQVYNSVIRCVSVELQVSEQMELRQRIDQLEEDLALQDNKHGYVA